MPVYYYYDGANTPRIFTEQFNTNMSFAVTLRKLKVRLFTHILCL